MATGCKNEKYIKCAAIGCGFCDDLNGVIGDIVGEIGYAENSIKRWTEDGVDDMIKWYKGSKTEVDNIITFFKEEEANLNFILQEIQLLTDILNMNWVAYIQMWLFKVLGISIEAAFWIAIILVIVVILGILGGVVSLLRLFI